MQYPAHVAAHGAGLQLSKGDDLGHMAFAIAALHIVDNLIAPILAEVDIEIGHGHAVRIEEALKQQVESQGIKIRDGERIGHQ